MKCAKRLDPLRSFPETSCSQVQLPPGDPPSVRRPHPYRHDVARDRSTHEGAHFEVRHVIWGRGGPHSLSQCGR